MGKEERRAQTAIPHSAVRVTLKGDAGRGLRRLIHTALLPRQPMCRLRPSTVTRPPTYTPQLRAARLLVRIGGSDPPAPPFGRTYSLRGELTEAICLSLFIRMRVSDSPRPHSQPGSLTQVIAACFICIVSIRVFAFCE